MKIPEYYVYIVTNFKKTVLYTGITSDLQKRVYQHFFGFYPGFTSKYKCKYLVYYERFSDVNEAIRREKQIKLWKRDKKDKLITAFNPQWQFLNDNIR